MDQIKKSAIISIIVLTFLLCGGIVKATTLSEVLEGILDARKPASLSALSFTGDLAIDLTDEAGGFIPREADLLAAWRAPDEWICSFELSGDRSVGMEGLGAAHPAVDHVLLSRPDFIDVLDIDWTVEYQGTAMWDGDPAWKLFFRPTDLNSPEPGFNLYVRKDDFQPLRTEVTFSDGTTGITDLTWVTVSDVLVPSNFRTVLNPPIEPLSGFTTTYCNHEINPDLSDFQFTRQEGSLSASNDPEIIDGPAIFEELYHGFENDPIIAPLNDSSGTYDRLKFTFTLYVEDRDVFWELDDEWEAVRNVAIEVISGWEWSGDNGIGSIGGKYECGRNIRDAIGAFLSTDAITDFYFIMFEPLSEG